MAIDAIVIGSGFGGAVTACRLAEAGMSVLVLERGRRWDNRNFPRRRDDAWLWSHQRPELHNGWLDFRSFPGMSVAQAAGVGGGSLIYANVSCEAPPSAFAMGWPQRSLTRSLNRIMTVSRCGWTFDRCHKINGPNALSS